MDKSKENFMSSPLIVWLRTFDERSTLTTIGDVADGIVLNKVMTAVDAGMFPSSNVVKGSEGSVRARFDNLQLLVNRIVEFYKTSLQHLVVSALPDISLIAQNPDDDQSLDELEKLLLLLLGCVVQCDNKEPLIEAMKTMANQDQHALVAYIQQVTETTSYVCSYDWTSFKDMTKENVEALCQAAFDHLFYMSSERHKLHKLLSEITMERNYFREGQQSGSSSKDLTSPMATKQFVLSPSPQVNQEVIELRTKVRNLQEQLDRKVDTLADSSQQFEQAKSMIQKLQLEKRDLFEKLHSQQVYQDEVEMLQAQAAKCERLEAEMGRCRKRAEDAEYMKKRIEELIHQNELMVETKALLEEKAASLGSRAEAYDELQTEMAGLRVQLESLNQEKELDITRMEEYISQSARFQLENKALTDKVIVMESQLEEDEEDRITNESFTEQRSNLSFEIKEADVANKTKLARLEKDSAELDRVREELRTASARVAEMEKINRKLNDQAHTDKKNIIKVNEELEMMKVKASRAEKLQAELTATKEKFEEVSVLRGKVKEWKTRNEQAMEFKARLDDEVEMLRGKASQYEQVVMELTQLKVQNSSIASEIEEEKSRSAEVLSNNAQLEMEIKSKAEEVAILMSQLEQAQSKQTVAMPTFISPPRVTESEMAAKVKLQRLEKEQTEMQVSLQAMRQAGAKAEQLEKTNKKLSNEVHGSRKEIAKLKEELMGVKQKASRLDTSQAEVKLLRQQSENSEMAKKQIKELKQQINLIIESKAQVEDERNVLVSKLENVSSWEEERASLRGKIEALEIEQDNSSRRLQELLETTAQLEIERDRKDMEIQDLMSEIENEKVKLSLPPVPESPKGIMSSAGIVENCVTATAIEKEELMAGKLRKLEREKSELEGAISALKKNNASAQEELAKGNRRLAAELETVKKENMRVKEEWKREKGQKTNLTQNLAKVKEDFRKSLMVMEVAPDWEEKMREDKTKDKRIEDIEARMTKAYKKTLEAKQERIGELEKRLEEHSVSNIKLSEELTSVKKQSKLQRMNTSPVGSPSRPFKENRFSLHGMGESPLQFMSTVGPSDLGKLKEKAVECDRLRQQLDALKDDNQNLVEEVMDCRQLLQEMEASNIRLQDRYDMSEELRRTLEEENKTLLQQTNKLLSHNHVLLMNTLESKESYMEEERTFKNRVDALEMQRERLQQELEFKKKEAVVRELELYRKQQKKPGLFKRGIQKLKGKISHRPSSHSSSQVAIDGFSQSRSNTFLSGGPYGSHKDSNASSDEQQSLSSSTGQSESDLRDSHLFVPPMNSSPRTPGRDKSMSLPRGTSGGFTPSYLTGATTPSGDAMTLQDFLSESDKTPKSKRKYIEVTKAMSSYTPGRKPAGPNTSQVSHISRSSLKSVLEPRSEVVEIPEFLRTGGSPGQQKLGGRLRAVSDTREISHSQLSFGSNCSNASSNSFHSSSRSSDINRVGDGQVNRHGSVNSNNNSNNNSNSNNNNSNNSNNSDKKGQFLIYPASFHRERAQTLDPSSGRRSVEASPLSMVSPQSVTTSGSGLRVPVRQYRSAVAKTKSIEDLSQSPQQIRQRPDRPLRMHRASSSDILNCSESTQGRCYSEVTAKDGRRVKRWSSGDILEDGRSLSSLAALTNIDTDEKKQSLQRGSPSVASTVHLDLNTSIGSANTTWYDYGAV